MCLAQDITIAIYSFMKNLLKQTGIKVNVVSGKDKALQKRIIEGGRRLCGRSIHNS